MRKPCIRGLPRVGRILGRQARGRRIRNGTAAKSTRKGRQKKNPGGNDTAGAQTEQWANPERLTAARGWAPASSPRRRRPAARSGSGTGASSSPPPCPSPPPRSPCRGTPTRSRTPGASAPRTCPSTPSRSASPPPGSRSPRPAPRTGPGPSRRSPRRSARPLEGLALLRQELRQHRQEAEELLFGEGHSHPRTKQVEAVVLQPDPRVGRYPRL